MTDERPEERGESRVPLLHPVRLRYRLFQEFIQEVSSNISVGGMFIATEKPHEPGSELDFEVALEDGFPLVKGRAEVVWVRKKSTGLNRPAGMGVRFVELQGESQSLVEKIVERYRQRGQTPFDLDREKPEPEIDQEPGPAQSAEVPPASPSRVEEIVAEVRRTATEGISAVEAETRLPPVAPSDDVAAVPLPASEPEVVAAGSPAETGPLRRTGRLVVVGLAAVVLGLLVVWLFHLFWVQPRIEELEARVARLSSGREILEGTVAPQAQPAATPSDPPPLSEAETQGETSVESPSRPLEVVEEWARAWSEKRIEDYLGLYAVGFEPSSGMSRDEWEAMRRRRIARHTGIRVQVLLVEETQVGPDEMLVSFVQAYRSDGYQDRVRKALRLIREDGAWRIASEQVVRALPD